MPLFLLDYLGGSGGGGDGQFGGPVGFCAFVTKWGSNGSGDGEFQEPTGVAVDGSGNVFVADNYNHRAQKFDNTGTFLTKWGSSGGGDGQFAHPNGVAVDGGGQA